MYVLHIPVLTTGFGQDKTNKQAKNPKTKTKTKQKKAESVFKRMAERLGRCPQIQSVLESSTR